MMTSSIEVLCDRKQMVATIIHLVLGSEVDIAHYVCSKRGSKKVPTSSKHVVELSQKNLTSVVQRVYTQEIS